MKTNNQTNRNSFTDISTHERAHADEIGGVLFLKCFGESTFPGVSKAQINFLRQEPKSPSPKTIYVGIGEDKFSNAFDEHRANGGRIQGTCAAILVAQRLKICNKPGVQDLLPRLLWCDTRSDVFASELANLIKAMHTVKSGANQFDTYLWATAAMEAVIFSKGVDHRYDIRRAWDNYCDDKKVKVGASVETVEQLIFQSHGRRNSSVTELAFICALMKVEVRQRWLPETFGMLLRNADLFQQAIAEINANAEIVELEVDGKPEGEGEPMMVIQSDSEMIGRAGVSSKVGKTTVTIIRNGSGNIQIFANPRSGLGLANLAAMIRMQEYKAATGKILSFTRAIGEGAIPQCPQWYLQNSNILLNGSFTHPLVKPSKLTLSEVRDIATCAFKKALCDKWFEEYVYTARELTLEAA